MSHTIIGVFNTAQQAQQAIQQLLSNGFMQDRIDISSQYDNSTVAGNQDVNHSDAHNNFFKSLFDNDHEVDSYSQAARKGSVVTVHAQSAQEAQQAASLLDQYGAIDVNEGTLQSGSRVDTSYTNASTTGSSIPVIEENLQVGKQVVETGGVRLHSRIIEKPVEESLRLREEHVHVERHPADRTVSKADLDAFQEGVIELTEHAEVPIVSKQAQVVEEVTISKEVEERTETIRDTVRSTEVEVENLSSGDLNTASHLSGTASGALDSDTAFLEKSHQEWQGALRRMKEVESDYKVAEDDPDVRGWKLVSSDGEKIGEIDELIVDTNAMKVRYLDVELNDRLLTSDDDDRHILVPIGSATLDRDREYVMVPNLDNQMLSSLPAYRGENISRDFEHKVISAFSPGYQAGNVSDDHFYEGEHFDTNRFSGLRR